MKRRPAIQSGTTGLITTAAVCSGTAALALADDLGEPYAALSIVCVAVVAITAVRRLITRAETAEDQAAAVKRQLEEERARRASVEREYRDLVDDYNDLAREEAGRFSRPAKVVGHEGHGPRCPCGRRGPRAFLTLIDTETRQGSA
ncbi:hypothetical protein ACKI16_29855 [Streptomyces scabiei]|uniref:hypothetical protein n=1 Tax=Streptomyces scabiei TaxID=1930 RepID=UPI0038F78330